MGMSTNLRNSLLDSIFNAVAFQVVTLTCSLHTADPGDSGTNEVVGGSYARQDVTSAFGAAAAGAVTNTGLVQFTLMPATTATHVGFWAGSTFLWGQALTASKTLNAGDTFEFAIGDLDATIT